MGSLKPQEESKELLNPSDIQKVVFEECLSLRLCFQKLAWSHPSWSLIILHMDIRDIWLGLLESAGILKLPVYWEAKGDTVSWIHAYNKHATDLITQQDWERRFYVPELQVIENWHWFKFSLRIWLYLFNQDFYPLLSGLGNMSSQPLEILILFLFGFTWTSQAKPWVNDE